MKREREKARKGGEQKKIAFDTNESREWLLSFLLVVRRLHPNPFSVPQWFVTNERVSSSSSSLLPRCVPRGQRLFTKVWIDCQQLVTPWASWMELTLRCLDWITLLLEVVQISPTRKNEVISKPRNRARSEFPIKASSVTRVSRARKKSSRK